VNTKTWEYFEVVTLSFCSSKALVQTLGVTSPLSLAGPKPQVRIPMKLPRKILCPHVGIVCLVGTVNIVCPLAWTRGNACNMLLYVGPETDRTTGGVSEESWHV